VCTKSIIKNIIDNISKINAPIGRMEKVQNNKNMIIFIDFAHTPDSLEQALLLLHEYKSVKSKIIIIFGCGGNRDRQKRPIMGFIASILSDIAIVTSDNPRHENPNAIIDDILDGICIDKLNLFQDYEFVINQINLLQKKYQDKCKIHQCNIIKEVNRETAIRIGLSLMKNKDDILILTGKGHENYVIIGDIKYAFNEHEILLDQISRI
jgi:UDP-N-acetylmuramoyl-L-alanyl-D-glutamate--2,6-diaminopimelate ligase